MIARHVHGSRLYRKNTLLSPLPSGKHGCHVPVHAHLHAQLARPPLFKVTVQGLGTLSSGTPASGLPMRLCSSTLILIKPRFSGRESRVGGWWGCGAWGQQEWYKYTFYEGGHGRRWHGWAGGTSRPRAPGRHRCCGVPRSGGLKWWRLHLITNPLLLRPLQGSQPECGLLELKVGDAAQVKFMNVYRY